MGAFKFKENTLSREVTIVVKVDNQFSAPLQQFKTEVDGISQSSTQLAQTTNNVDNSFNNMASSITAGVIAFASWQGIQAVGQLFDLGQQVNIATVGFNSLTESVGGSTAVLQALREATQGASSDTDLMNEANKLLSLNLVSNTADLANFIGTADDLGDIFTTGTQGVADFTKALESGRANSLIRYGIDIDAVKRRAEELKATMSDKDAFRMAAMEQAKITLERFGNAADAAATPIDRVKASVKNLIDQFGRDFEVGASSAAGILEIMGGQNPIQISQQKQIEEFATSNAIAYSTQFFDTLDEQFAQAQNAETWFTPEYSQKILGDLFKNMKSNPNLDLSSIVQNTLLPLTGTMDDEHMQMLAGQLFSFAQLQKTTEATAIAQQAEAAALAESARQAQLLQSYQAIPEDRQLALGQQREALEIAQQHRDATIEYSNAIAQVGNELLNISHVQDPMGGMYTAKLSKDQVAGMLPSFMTSGEAEAITAQFRDAEDELTRLHALADQKLITDDQLKQAENMTSNLGLLADQAQTAADNFKNLSLAQALGQGGGGMQGEMTDMIISQMQSAGASKEAIAAMQSQLDMASGRETGSSEEMKTVIIPMMAKMSASHAAVAMANLDKYLKDAVLQGLTDEQIAAALPGILAGGDGEGGTSKGKTDTFQKMGGYMGGKGGKASEPPTTAIAKDMTNITKDSQKLEQFMGTTSDHFHHAATDVKYIHDQIKAIPDHKPLTFVISANDPAGILPVIKLIMGGGADLAGAMANATRDNGGVPPGSTGGSTRTQG